jgi:beta-glucosidase
MKKISLISSICLMMAVLVSCTIKEKKPQPVLGTRSVTIIEKNGLKFKDLNKNGKLDKYEDWRLTPDERSKDLLSKMSLKEKVGFMLINSANMIGTARAEASGNKLAASDLDDGAGRSQGGGGGGFGQNRARQGAPGVRGRQGTQAEARQGGQGGARQNAQGAARQGAPRGNGEQIANMNSSGGTARVIKEFHNRHFILRSNESARVTAEWANKLQELCESEPLGIPAIITSNPRNNITTNASLGTSVGTTVFSLWPGELGYQLCAICH